MENKQNSVRHRLKELQDFLNLTQEEMAKAGGRKRITYAEYIRENNPSTPGADFIGNLVLNTGVNANWLLTGQGEMFMAVAEASDLLTNELLLVYPKLSDRQKALLVELGKALAGSDEDGN